MDLFCVGNLLTLMKKPQLEFCSEQMTRYRILVIKIVFLLAFILHRFYVNDRKVVEQM